MASSLGPAGANVTEDSGGASGVDVNKSAIKVLEAAKKGDVAAAELALRECVGLDVDVADGQGFTALIISARYVSFNCVLALFMDADLCLPLVELDTWILFDTSFEWVLLSPLGQDWGTLRSCTLQWVASCRLWSFCTLLSHQSSISITITVTLPSFGLV